MKKVKIDGMPMYHHEDYLAMTDEEKTIFKKVWQRVKHANGNTGLSWWGTNSTGYDTLFCGEKFGPHFATKDEANDYLFRFL